MKKNFVDYFSGIGLVQLGLNKGRWTHSLSVDYNEKKKRAYESNFDKKHHDNYLLENIFNVHGEDITESFLAHASFPCTDVSAAGSKEGSQSGGESSAIDSFLRILGEMRSKTPPMIMLENVKGLLTSNKGTDLRFLVQRLNKLGYIVDILCIDARNFVPQSRERVFIIGHYKGYNTPSLLTEDKILQLKPASGKTPAVIKFIKDNTDLEWCFHPVPELPTLKMTLDGIIDNSENYWTAERTSYLCSQMFERHLTWVNEKKNNEYYSYGTVFRRMRSRCGKNQSTAELRTDGIAGCLRTSKGGSAKQILIKAGKNKVEARLLSPKECAHLMGAPNYILPGDMSIGDALYCFGDAVCVNVIEWIDENYLSPFYDKYSREENNHDLVRNNFNINVVSLESGLSKNADLQYNNWVTLHNIDNSELFKEKIYSALVILSNIEDGQWCFSELIKIKSYQDGKYFTDKGIRNNTNHRIRLILSTHLDEYKISLTKNNARSNNLIKISSYDFIKIIINVYRLGLEYGIAEKELSIGILNHFYTNLFNEISC